MVLTLTWVLNFLVYSVTLSVVLYFYFTRKFNYWKNKGVPYLKPVPFLGNISDLLTLKTSIGEYFGDVYHKSKEAFVGIFVFDQPCLVIRDPELIKAVLIKDFNHFYDRSVTDNKKDDPMGSHILFVIKNPDWRKLRLKLAPVFTSGKMKGMLGLINEIAEDLTAFMSKTIGEDGSVLEAREICGKFSTDVISSCAFGINSHCFEHENSQFRVVARRIFNWNSFTRGVSMTCYFIAPNLVKLLKMKFLDPFSVNFLRKAFWETMEERERSQHFRNDLLDLLLKIKKEENLQSMHGLDSDKLVAQAAQFFIAGFETTSSTISFTLYELAKRPEVQEKLRNEINSLLSEYGGFTYDALKAMEYLDMCIKETLRMYPVLAFLDRRCNEDYKIPGTDVILEKGTSVFIPAYGLHFDPQYYPDPEKYDPERFTEENIANRHPLTYIPFGDGPRNCIGARFGTLTSKLGVATVISKYKIEMCKNTPSKLKFDPKGFLLAPVGGIPLKFTKK